MATNQRDEPLVSKEFFPNLRKSMLELRSQEALLDFTIIVDENVFRVHKFVLAASSDYFRTMFLHNQTKEVLESTVHLKDISVTAMKAIIDFCYTSEIALNDENAQDIIQVASRLQVNQVLELASKFFVERINLSNCLRVYSMAKYFQIKPLMDVALRYCLKNFKYLTEEQEFLDIDDSCLSDLISNDQLNVDEEELVLAAVIKWTCADIENRKSKLEEIAFHVRFSTMDVLGLINSASESLLQDQPSCIRYIDDAKNFLLLKDRPDLRSQLRLEGKRFMSRNTLRRQQRIYSVGGWTNQFRPTKGVEVYNPYDDSWVEVSSMPETRCGVGAAILNESLFAVGGYDGQQHVNSVLRYDILEDKWYKDVASMNVQRTSVGVVSLNGYIYAIGGQVERTPSNIVERYEIATNTWTECAHLNLSRNGAGVVTFDGYIYAIGGGGSVERELDSVERYDPKTNEWTYLSNMLSKRKHLSCAVYNGKIYAIGGRGEKSDLASCECYDPIANTWEAIQPMSEQRSGLGLVELDGILFAIGGACGEMRLKSVEAYDITTNVWSKRRCMNQERLGAGCVAYSKLDLVKQSA